MAASASSYPSRDRHARTAWLVARLRSASLNGELAAGIPSWRSPAHAARALQITSARHRRGLAGSLERLLDDAEMPRTAMYCAAVPVCREQVRNARPVLLAVASRLRSTAPVDARGIAQLRSVLCDGSGPCYLPSQPGDPRLAVEELSRSLDVLD